LLGPFEEEEEGTGIASDAVKVQGEDPATPDYYLRSADTRKPRDRNTQDHNDSPISLIKTKQHKPWAGYELDGLAPHRCRREGIVWTARCHDGVMGCCGV